MIKNYKKFLKENSVGMGSLYHTQYPYQYNTVDNPSDRGKEGNIEYHKTVNKFQSIQNEIKNLIEVDLRKKDSNITELDIENELKNFLNISDDKKQIIREISDGCTDIKKCAKEIYGKFKKYSDIKNYKDDVNDISESIDWNWVEEEESDLKEIFKNEKIISLDLNDEDLDKLFEFLIKNKIEWRDTTGPVGSKLYGKGYIKSHKHRNLKIKTIDDKIIIIYSSHHPNITLEELLKM